MALSLVGATALSLVGQQRYRLSVQRGLRSPVHARPALPHRQGAEARDGDGRPSPCYCTLTTVMTGDIMKRLLPVS